MRKRSQHSTFYAASYFVYGKQAQCTSHEEFTQQWKSEYPFAVPNSLSNCPKSHFRHPSYIFASGIRKFPGYVRLAFKLELKDNPVRKLAVFILISYWQDPLFPPGNRGLMSTMNSAY